MAKIVIKNAFLSLGGTDYSAQIESIEFKVEADEQVVTNMDSAGWEEVLQGIRKGTMTVNFKFDADLSGFHAAVYAVFAHATDNTWAYVLKRDDSAVSSANPSFTGTLLVKDYMLNLKVGEAFQGTHSFPLVGAPVRATT